MAQSLFNLVLKAYPKFTIQFIKQSEYQKLINELLT